MMRLMLVLALAAPGAALAQPSPPPDLDQRVRAFLDSRRGQWRDLNVPEEDGRALHELIVERKFTRALEIGTSTATRRSGSPGPWLARAGA
jgi:predicted O-methyltransferase YrrM